MHLGKGLEMGKEKSAFSEAVLLGVIYTVIAGSILSLLMGWPGFLFAFVSGIGVSLLVWYFLKLY